jgi:hypothetical protein
VPARPRPAVSTARNPLARPRRPEERIRELRPSRPRSRGLATTVRLSSGASASMAADSNRRLRLGPDPEAVLWYPGWRLDVSRWGGAASGAASAGDTRVVPRRRFGRTVVHLRRRLRSGSSKSDSRSCPGSFSNCRAHGQSSSARAQRQHRRRSGRRPGLVARPSNSNEPAPPLTGKVMVAALVAWRLARRLRRSPVPPEVVVPAAPRPPPPPPPGAPAVRWPAGVRSPVRAVVGISARPGSSSSP